MMSIGDFGRQCYSISCNGNMANRWNNYNYKLIVMIYGQIINVLSLHSITFDVTSSNLKGISADITTASGDVTNGFIAEQIGIFYNLDVSTDMSSVSGGAALQVGLLPNLVLLLLSIKAL